MTNRRMDEIIRHQHPVTMPASASVREACGEMHKRKIGAILVTDAQGSLTGIFTGRDLVRIIADGKDVAEVTLRSAMTHKPHTMPPGHTAIDALRVMRDGGFRHIPVVDEGKVIGIVSRGDFRGLEHDRLDVETGYWERMRGNVTGVVRPIGGLWWAFELASPAVRAVQADCLAAKPGCAV
jgi:CBS domain-containing protein